MARKIAFKAFLISNALAMCSSLAVAFICVIARLEDLEFLLYYRSFTKKLMWFAFMATTTAFATGLYTTGNRHFAECRRLCRMYFIGHSAKKIHSAKKNTRQNASLPSAFFWHSANMYFAECYFSAHGKMRLCRVSFILALGKYVFCRVPLFWHSAKRHFAVCIFFGPRQISFSKQFLRP